MMKNRAILLALAVLAAATILMVFVVLPWASKDRQSLGEVADRAGEAVQESVQQGGEAATESVAQIKEKATATLEKMSRLSAAAETAVGDLAGLFDADSLPAAEAFAEARGKAAAPLGELAALELPEGLAAEAQAKAQRARENAARAVEWLKALPDDPAAAAFAVRQLPLIFPGGDRGTAAEQPAEAQSGAGQPAAEGSTPASIAALPAFDLLRVEPDGSTVIAGRAAPGATVEIVNGDTVVTAAVAGSGGEFAAVLDEPLAPGDHQLALRATDADGATVLSGEVATVSVPEDKDGQLLAMISTPGQASRLVTVPTAPADPAAQSETASAGSAATGDAAPQAAAPATPQAAPPAGGPDVHVSAVEIEGDRIFVAGTARPGVTIRAFAGNSLIGEIETDSAGNFVVEGVLPLPPGDHVITAELLDAAGNVVVKTSVPFNRPEGHQVAVVAPGASASPAPDGDAAAQALEDGALGKLRTDAARAFALLKSLFEDGKVPGNEALAAARSATEIALKALAEFLPSSDAEAAVRQESATASAAAAKAFAFLSDLPRDAASVGAALTELSGLIDGALGIAPAGTPASAEPRTISQAPLTPSDSSVIIRRGDTLWQISRRVYGQGVRYTTIYLANRDEIRNPDLIAPGQVFTVPREALPNAEELHRKRLSGETLQ